MLGALKGDFGTSYSYKMPVSSMLAGKLPVTGLLTGMSFVLLLAFSIPLGIFTARHAGGRLDRAMTAVNQVLMAIPAFVTGILLFPPATTAAAACGSFCSRPCPSPCPGWL